MSKPEVSYEIAKSCMKMLSEGLVSGELESFGITVEDMELVFGNKPWIGRDRHKVEFVLDTATFSTLDIIGLPRFNVPAEYRASIIAMFVHPANVAVACVWSETKGPSVEGVIGGDFEEVSASKLFSLVCALTGEGKKYYDLWEKKVGISVNRYEGEENA